MGFVDLHSHVLAGLDDGSPDLATSVAMLRGLRTLGFTTVCATPHQKTGQFLPKLEACRTAHTTLLSEAGGAGVDLTIPLAAENMWDSTFYERLEADQIPSYDDGDSFLVEFQLTALPARLFDHLFQLTLRGKLPVIAHPERYEPLWSDKSLAKKLADNCAMVVDLGAVAGYHGRRQAKAARAYLKGGIAHAVASDAHSENDVRVAAEGIAWIEKKLGSGAVERLLETNPRAILRAEHPEG